MANTSGVRINKEKLNRLMDVSPRNAELLMDTIAFDGDRDVKQSFTTSPSSPGEPPGVVTGALKSSIHVEKPARFVRRIVAGTEYAAALEFGTVRGLSPRPFMMPMAMRLQKAIPNYFSRFIEL